MPYLSEEKRVRGVKLILAGLDDLEIAGETGVNNMLVGKERRSLPVATVPRPELPAPQRVRQVGERWSEEHNFMVRIFSPAWAAGDIRDDRFGKEEA